MIRSEASKFERRSSIRNGPRRTARLNGPAEYFNSLARDVARMIGAPGQSLILAEMFLGKTSESPTYADARYTITRSRPKWSLSVGDLLDLEIDQSFSSANQTVTATNLSEMLAGAHDLAANTPVFVFGLIIPKLAKTVQYFFVGGASSLDCTAEPSTFTVVGDVAYTFPNFTKTLTEFEIDWCAHTITEVSSEVVNVFTVGECDEDTAPTAGERVFSADRTISANNFYQVAGYITVQDGAELTIEDGAELLIT